MKLFDVIYESEDLVVINKTAGLLSIPDRVQSAPSLKDILKEKYGQIFTVHRLDRDTSGLIVFAKNASTHQFLSQAFESRAVEKVYLGIVSGELIQKEGTLDQPIAEHAARSGYMTVHRKGKPSSTDYKELETFGMLSLVQFRIHTGRTHQIRVHMQHAGHPIVCDELYGNGLPVFISSLKKKYKLSRSEEEERPILNRLGLHASRLSFSDARGLDLNFEAPLPKDMKALLQQLRKWKG
jgi:23S rRNA pseudouridine1911/1915/1917 synthase